MLRQVTDFFMPADFVGDVNQTRQARIITNTVLLTSLFSTNFLVLCWWAGFWPGMYLMMFNVVAFVVLPFGFRHKLFSYVTFGYIYLTAGYLGVFLNSVYQGGFYAATTPWLVLCPVTATFLLGRRGGIIFFFLALLSVLALWELERRGVALPNTVPAEHLLFWRLDILGGLMLILLVVALVFDSINTRTLHLLTEKNDLLSLRTHQLEESLAHLRATQDLLVHSEKMASLGELTAGIAHEIQNPMNFVNNFSEVSEELLKELPADTFAPLPAAAQEHVHEVLDTLARNLSRIVRHGQRVDGIVRNMLQHAHTGPRERQRTILNQLAAEYLHLAYASARAKDPAFHITLHTTFHDQVGEVDMVAPDIGRVLLNLFNNALYALAERKKQQPDFPGQLTITTRRTPRHVEIAVTDNGHGMPDAVLQKVFQPFFTTKPAGTGTGLGLSLSHDIVVKGHGGQFTAESVEGVGATFRIRLPG